MSTGLRVRRDSGHSAAGWALGKAWLSALEETTLWFQTQRARIKRSKHLAVLTTFAPCLVVNGGTSRTYLEGVLPEAWIVSLLFTPVSQHLEASTAL